MAGKIISLAEHLKKLKKQETRTKWENFPPVFIFCKLGAASAHECYDLAKKEGDIEAAFRLAKDLVNDERVNKLKLLLERRKPQFVAVHAVEAFSINKIPIAVGRL